MHLSEARIPLATLALACGTLLLVGCSGSEEAGGRPGGAPASAAQRPGGGGAPGAGGPPQGAAAVPVETAPVVRREIASFIETNGTLEAENEVDIVARVSAPIVELSTEEGRAVRKGQVLARLEQDELRAQVEISKVALREAELALERAEELNSERLISIEEYEQARNRFETAKAQLEGSEILIGYTTIRAPFDGLIVARYVDFAEQVATNTRLFRISDFDPLLCPIQVPERELPLLRVGQEAFIEVEAWADERFSAHVLRISPVVDATTGTIKVTLEVAARGKLRPGMFARASLKTASKPDTLVIPRTALSLESIGDTVYIATDGKAERREVELGFQEGDSVEVLSGLAEGEQVVTVGQDGLSDGTPVQVLGDREPEPTPERVAGVPEGAAAPSGADGTPQQAVAPGTDPEPAVEADSRNWGDGSGMTRMDLSQATPEQLDRLKKAMRGRGMSEEEIEQRLETIRERQRGGGGSSPP